MNKERRVDQEAFSSLRLLQLYGPEGTEISGRDIIGNGVDLCDASVTYQDVISVPGYKEENFTPEEIAYCDDATNIGERSRRYGARIAAKEALAKALGGVPKGQYGEAAVVKNKEGAPRLELTGSVKERADQLGVESIFLSVSHEHQFAIAWCIAVGRRLK